MIHQFATHLHQTHSEACKKKQRHDIVQMSFWASYSYYVYKKDVHIQLSTFPLILWNYTHMYRLLQQAIHFEIPTFTRCLIISPQTSTDNSKDKNPVSIFYIYYK